MTEHRIANAFETLDEEISGEVLNRERLESGLRAAGRRRASGRVAVASFAAASVAVVVVGLTGRASHEDRLLPGGNPTSTASAASDPLRPDGYMATPEPGLIAYLTPFLYVRPAPADAAPLVTAVDAFANERANGLAGPTPLMHLGLYTELLARPPYRDRLAWVFQQPNTTTDDTHGHTYTGCTGVYVLDALNGKALYNGRFCPRSNPPLGDASRPDLTPTYLPAGTAPATPDNANSSVRNEFWTLPDINPYTHRPLSIGLQQFAGAEVSPLASDYIQVQAHLGVRDVLIRTPKSGYGAFVITWQNKGSVYELLTERLRTPQGDTVGLSLEELEKIAASIP